MKRKAISVTGDGELVAAATGRAIVVENYYLTASAALDLKFTSVGSTTTDLTGTMELSAANHLSPPYVEDGLFETLPGEALNIDMTGAGTVSGFMTYHYK